MDCCSCTEIVLLSNWSQTVTTSVVTSAAVNCFSRRRKMSNRWAHICLCSRFAKKYKIHIIKEAGKRDGKEKHEDGEQRSEWKKRGERDKWHSGIVFAQQEGPGFNFRTFLCGVCIFLPVSEWVFLQGFLHQPITCTIDQSSGRWFWLFYIWRWVPGHFSQLPTAYGLP